MCATNLWAIDAGHFSPEFQKFTSDRLGAPVIKTDFRIVSRAVARTDAVFIVTRALCDCSTLIGRRGDPEDDQEATADEWLSWLADLPRQCPGLARIAVLRAWNPQGEKVTPRKTREVTLNKVTEAVLRDLRDDTLLAVTYPTE